MVFAQQGQFTVLFAAMVNGTYQGMLRSEDNGTTWSACGSMTTVTRMMTAHDGSVWAATKLEGLWKLDDPHGCNWHQLFYQEGNYTEALSVLSSNSSVAMALKAPNGDHGTAILTVDGGSTWRELNTTRCLQHGSHPAGCHAAFSEMVQDVLLRETSEGIEAWVGEGGGAYRVKLPQPLSSVESVVFKSVVANQEEVFVLSLHFPGNGSSANMLAGTADVSGMTWAYNATAPGHGLANEAVMAFSGPDSLPGAWGLGYDLYAETVGLASAPYDDALLQGFPTLVNSSLFESEVLLRAVISTGTEVNHHWVKAPNRLGMVSASVDGGLTWHRNAAWLNNNTLRKTRLMGVAVSCTSAAIITITTQNDYPFYTQDGGVTWTSLMGQLPFFAFVDYSGNRYNMSKALAASSTIPRQFIYYDWVTGSLFESHDGAVSWQQIAAGPASSRVVVSARVGQSGFVIALDHQGVYTYTPGAGTLIKLRAIDRAHIVASGLGLQADVDCMYVFGNMVTDPILRVYASCDAKRQDWTALVDSSKGLGNWAEVMAASPRVPGLVAIGSFGRGAFWTQASVI
jgi:photosystem II stability/assembly factor-like uncharacterized protein